MAIANVVPGAYVYQHGNCGMPYKGSTRRRPPRILMVCHITGNSNLPSALAEIQYSARVGSGASFPFCVNRNGTFVQAYDPVLYAPWTNGDIQNPDMTNPVIAQIAREGANPNEDSFMTVEAVGYEPGSPYTDAQVETIAKIVAWGYLKAKAKGWNLPIDAVRVIGHYQINGVTRTGCPTRGDKLALRTRIITRARALVGAPAPTPPAGDDDMDARPRTFHPRMGSVSLIAGQEYNAFRLMGRNADGTPILKRLNGIKYPSNTSARVIGLAHWDADKAPADCFMVTPYASVPPHGEQVLIYWSKSPLAPPKVIWAPDAGTAADAVAKAAADAAAKY